MDTLAFLEYLETTSLGEWVAYSMWGYPISLALHALGMATVVGITAVICLRLLGFPKTLPLKLLARFFPLMMAGMILNAVTGIVLFLGGASTLFYNLAFQLKITAIVLGLVMIRFLQSSVLKPFAQGGEQRITAPTRLLAVGIIVVWWLSVILSGRLIAYVGG